MAVHFYIFSKQSFSLQNGQCNETGPVDLKVYIDTLLTQDDLLQQTKSVYRKLGHHKENGSSCSWKQKFQKTYYPDPKFQTCQHSIKCLNGNNISQRLIIAHWANTGLVWPQHVHRESHVSTLLWSWLKLLLLRWIIINFLYLSRPLSH